VCQIRYIAAFGGSSAPTQGPRQPQISGKKNPQRQRAFSSVVSDTLR
jgi:hypothetical protein